MRAPQSRRTPLPFVDVQEPGKGKALLHVLADGRSTGHYRLNKRQLDKVGSARTACEALLFSICMNLLSILQDGRSLTASHRFPRCGRGQLQQVRMTANGGKPSIQLHSICHTTTSGIFPRMSVNFQGP